MSGWKVVPGVRLEYGLTATKAHYWHGRRGCCETFDDIVRRHVEPLGWDVARRGAGYIDLVVPGPKTHPAGPTELWTAVRGGPRG